MSWKEVSTGRYERPAGSNELYLLSLAEQGRPIGRAHWAVYSCCSIELQNHNGDVVERIKRAWIALRHDLPGIAAELVDGIFHYTSPDSAGLEAWALQTFSVHPEVSSSDELIASLRPVPLPMLKYLPRTSQLILHGPHHNIDGTGSVKIWDRFFKNLSSGDQPKFGDEGKSLVPSLEAAIDGDEKCGPEVEAFLNEDISNIISKAPFAGLPYNGDTSTIPGDSGRYPIVFSESSTSALISACKQKGISVTAAISATLSETIWEFTSPETKDYSVFQLMALDPRPYMKEPYNYAADAAYATAFFGVVKPHQPWIDTAQTFMAAIRKYKSGEIMLQSRLTFVEKFGVLFKPVEGAPPPSDFTVSSLGDISRFLDQDYGDLGSFRVKIKDFYPMLDVLTRQITAFVWTFRGKLHLSLSYNTVYYDRLFLDRIAKNLIDVLSKELTFEIDWKNE